MSALINSCTKPEKHEPHWATQPPTGGLGGVWCEGNPAHWDFDFEAFVNGECLPPTGCTCLGHKMAGVHHLVPCCDKPHIEDQLKEIR